MTEKEPAFCNPRGPEGEMKSFSKWQTKAGNVLFIVFLKKL